MPDPSPERALIGATLNQPRPEALRAVLPEDFYLPAHETIWAAIRDLDEAGTAIDTVTVVDHLKTRGTLASVGGLPYIAELVTEGSNPAAATSYARIVVENAARRRLTTAGTRIAQIAESGEGNVGDLVGIAIAEIEASHRPTGLQTATLAEDLLAAVLDDLDPEELAPGIAWPYADAARLLHPMQPGQLIIVGARPRVGKSVTLVDLARHAAIHQDKTVVLHSLEMSAVELMKRLLAAEARVTMDRMISRDLQDDDWHRITQAGLKLNGVRLHIIDEGRPTLADLRASVKKYKPDMLILDYIQMAKVNPKIERRLALEEFTRGLKQMARSAGVTIVTAAQLSRPEKGRAADKPPVLEDLREAGGLEQDADTVILLHRPDAADPEHARAGEVDFVVGKQRNGPGGTIHLAHQMHYSRIVDMAHQ